MRARYLFFVFWFLTFGALFAQIPTPLPTPPPASNPEEWNEKIRQMAFRRDDTEYRVGPSDIIELKVFGVEALNQDHRINGSGEINVPILGVVSVGGLTTGQIESKVRDLLIGRLVQDPYVTVSVKEYRSQVVFLFGAARNPGEYKLVRTTTLVDLLAMAGGIDTGRAVPKAIVQKAYSPSAAGADPSTAQPVTVTIDLRELFEKGNRSLNITLDGGDIIQIPERVDESYYVIGEVAKPGVFTIPVNRSLFLSQALAEAGGPAKNAKAKKGLLIRFDEKGGRMEIAVDLDGVLKGKVPDMFVQPNDIVFVPGSTFRNARNSMLQLLPGVAVSLLWMIRY